MRRAQAQLIGDEQRTLKRVTLDDLSASTAHHITNQLYGAGDFTLGEPTWTWESICPSRIREWIVLQAGAEQLHLALDGDWVASESRQIDWRDYSGETRLIAWTACHESLLELLRYLFCRDWVPESIGDCDAPSHRDSVQAGFRIHRTDGLLIASGLTRFHTAHVAPLAARLTELRRRPRHAIEQVHAPLDVLIDEVTLDCDELAAFGRGCIVRLDNQTLLTARPRVVICAGSNRLIADIHASTATVVGIRGGHEMNIEPQAGSAPTDGAAIETGALPVRLSFRAGSLTMPMRRLSQIGAGYVFELEKRLDDQVITVHANDTPIAVGELVALGDLIGVRITRMLPKP